MLLQKSLNLILDPPDQDRGRALRFATEFKASSNASRIFVIKAEELSDRNTQFDSRLYSTDPNIYFRFIPNFGEITKGDFLKNVSLDFCERKYKDSYLVYECSHKDSKGMPAPSKWN